MLLSNDTMNQMSSSTRIDQNSQSYGQMRHFGSNSQATQSDGSSISHKRTGSNGFNPNLNSSSKGVNISRNSVSSIPVMNSRASIAGNSSHVFGSSILSRQPERPFSDVFQPINFGQQSSQNQQDNIQDYLNMLSSYENTLEEMAAASVDSQFKEELAAMEQWISAISDAERTMALYSFLQRASPPQLRFLLTVMQQMLRNDPMANMLSSQFTERDSISHNMSRAINHMSLDAKSSFLGHERQASSFASSRHSLLDEPGQSISRDGSSSTINQLFPEAAAAIAEHRNRLSQIGGLGLSQQRGKDGGSISMSRSPLSESLTPSHHSTSIQRPKSDVLDSTVKNAFATAGSSIRSPQPDTLFGDATPFHQTGNWASVVPTPTIQMFPRNSKVSEGKRSSQAFDDLSIRGSSNNWLSGKSVQGTRSSSAGMTNQNTDNDFRNYGRNSPSPGPYTGQDMKSETVSGLGPKSPFSYENDINIPISMVQDVISSPSLRGRQENLNSAISSPSMRSNQNGFTRSHNSFTPHNYVDRSSAAVGEGYYSDHAKSQSPSSSWRSSSARPAEDPTDPNLLKDIPAWLRSLRLHKYTANFQDMEWKEIIQLDDAGLESKGVTALGARRKLLKIFDQVKEAMAQGKL